MHHNYPDGRKIPRHLENPIDNVIIDVAEWANRYLIKVNVTPNMITSGSLLLGLSAAWFVYNGIWLPALLTTIVSYIMDCMDGNMARKYHLMTTFGDWFDHVSDVLKYVALYLAFASTSHLTLKIKIIFFAVTIVLLALMLKHLGCQENAYKKMAKDSMTALEPLCSSRALEQIKWTRYFGMGTWVTTICIFITLWAVSARF